MEENFEPVARTRANYYTPGSPVQFVCVELLIESMRPLRSAMSCVTVPYNS